MHRASRPGHFQLPRHYWAYQLLFAEWQLVTALLAGLCVSIFRSLAAALLFIVPLVLAFASVYTFGPAEKVGLVVESERLIVTGRTILFAEILGSRHRFEAKRFDTGEGCLAIHSWTLSVRLLDHSELVIHRTVASYADGDYAPRPDAKGRNMANVIRAALNVWHASTPKDLVRGLREDLQSYRRYRPVPRRWQAVIESPWFTVVTFIVALIAGLGVFSPRW
jgi:hypothetical protein